MNRIGKPIQLLSLVVAMVGSVSCDKGGGGTLSDNIQSAPAVVAYVGCYVDDGTRALQTALLGSGATVETCVAAAAAGNFYFAGLQYGGQCFAGNILGYAKAPETDCNMPCTADTTETCGAGWRNSIWTTAVGTQAPTPTPAPLPTGSAYVGCYVDDGTRALPNALLGSGSTVEGCIALAQTANYKYAGLQYGGQCFAGNTLGFAEAPATDCNMPCDANRSETCGAGWRNSIYSTGK